MTGLTPRVQSTSEPISAITTITNPLGEKNVAGTQINPATQDTLSQILTQLDITLSALRDAFIAAVGLKADAATADDLSDITTTTAYAKLRRILFRLSSDAFTATIQGAARTELDTMLAQLSTYLSASGAAYAATVNPGGSAKSNVEQTLEDIGDILAGAGITTFPAAAAAANGVSLGEVIHYIQDTVDTIITNIAALQDLAQSDILSDSTPFAGASVDLIKTQTDKIPLAQQETEWASTAVSQQVASASATALTIGSITPTFPTGATAVRVILLASLHAANQAANTHHVALKVEGQKAAGGYLTQLDLTAQPTLAMANADGAGDSWSGAIDVSALVDTSAAQYDFRFEVDSDNAGAINYTSSFVLVLVYTM